MINSTDEMIDEKIMKKLQKKIIFIEDRKKTNKFFLFQIISKSMPFLLSQNTIAIQGLSKTFKPKRNISIYGRPGQNNEKVKSLTNHLKIAKSMGFDMENKFMANSNCFTPKKDELKDCFSFEQRIKNNKNSAKSEIILNQTRGSVVRPKTANSIASPSKCKRETDTKKYQSDENKTLIDANYEINNRIRELRECSKSSIENGVYFKQELRTPFKIQLSVRKINSSPVVLKKNVSLYQIGGRKVISLSNIK